MRFFVRRLRDASLSWDIINTDKSTMAVECGPAAVRLLQSVTTLEADIPVERTRERRISGRKVVVILEKGFLEADRFRSRGGARLINSSDHKRMLTTTRNLSEDEASDARPDIVHQCLLHLQDSPLNRYGRLCVFVRTADRQLVEVHPQLTVPRTYPQFEKLMVHFLHTRKVKAVESSAPLLRLIKNDMDLYIPAGGPKIGLSMSGRSVDFPVFCADLASRFAGGDRERSDGGEGGDGNLPITFIVGAVAKQDPEGLKLPHVEDSVSIANCELTAAACCGKICSVFEEIWDLY